jgi:hypothetical protein
MTAHKTDTPINFAAHASAVIKAQRLAEMLTVEVDHLDNPEAEVLAEIAALEKAVKLMFTTDTRKKAH